MAKAARDDDLASDAGDGSTRDRRMRDYGVTLRRSKMNKGSKPLPHDGVWARLGVSGIHGVGVFAIRPIPAGTNVFGNDEGAIRWIEAEQIEGLPSVLKTLYDDFAIRDGATLGCPVNFNAMSVGWYVNQPQVGDQPNLTISDDYAMIANRLIVEGEELTIVYRTFSV